MEQADQQDAAYYPGDAKLSKAFSGWSDFRHLSPVTCLSVPSGNDFNGSAAAQLNRALA